MKQVAWSTVIGAVLLTIGVVGIGYFAWNKLEDHALLYTFCGISLVGALCVPSLAAAIGAGVKYAVQLAPWKNGGGNGT